MPCSFCDIAAGKSPAYIIHDTANVLAFLDIRPIHPGHTLVIPREHYERTIDIPGALFMDVAHTANQVARMITRALEPDGYNIFTSNGRAAGQSVFHVHLHVTPRYYDDGIRFHLQLKSYEKDGMKEMAARIRQFDPNRDA